LVLQVVRVSGRFVGSTTRSPGARRRARAGPKISSCAPAPPRCRASLSEDWTKDKAQRKEETKTSVDAERVGRSSAREEVIGAKKRASSRALSVEIDRSEKKAKPEESAAEPATIVYYAGPAFLKSPDPSEVPLPKSPLFVKSPNPSEVPFPKFLKLKTPTEE
jgi:hypothetical protein